jgi:hypothetical protein
MVAIRVRGVLPAAGLPRNAWTGSGDLLLDPAIDPRLTIKSLVEAMRRLPWQLAWFDEVPLDAPYWRCFAEELRGLGIRTSVRERYQVGLIPLTEAWECYWASIPKKFRQNVSQACKRLAKLGDVSLDMECGERADVLEAKLREGIDIEDASWKGEHGSSIVRRGMVDYFHLLATHLAAFRCLRLIFLRVAGKPVAFCFGAVSKGVFYYYKIGYDPAFAKYSPGQLLLYYLLQQLRTSGQCYAMDTIGEVTDATSRWQPHIYRVGQVVFAPRGAMGRTVTDVHQRWWPRIQRLLPGRMI